MVLIIALALVAPVAAATYTWTGAGVNNQWSTGANWLGGVAPTGGGDLVFPATAAQFSTVNDFAPGTTFTSITFSGSGYTIAGNSLSVIGQVDIGGGGATFLTGTISSGTITIVHGSTFEISNEGNIGSCSVVDNGVLEFYGSDGTASGSISGTGSLFVLPSSGYNGVILTGDNSNFKGSVISDSTNGPALQLGNGGSYGNIGNANTITVTGTNSLVFDMSGNQIFSGNIEDGVSSGSVMKEGTGTVIMTGTYSYTGVTTVNAGELQVSGTYTAGEFTVSGGTLGGNGTVCYVTVANTPSGTLRGGTGSLNAGTLTIDGPLTFNGASSALNVTSDGTHLSSISVSGTLTEPSGMTVNLLDPMPAGTYTLISDTGGLPTTLPTLGTNACGKTPVFAWVPGTGLVVTLYPAPTVTGISPATGSSLGGTIVTITGSSFTGATGVSFGGIPNTTPITVNSDSSITASTPPTTGAGYVDVKVTAFGGTSAANPPADYFGYLPVISGISPASGPTSGGNSVTIIGAGFYGVTSVAFGSQTAVAHSFSATIINATVPPNIPAGALGTVNVTLTTVSYSLHLYSVNTSASEYTYVGPPIITSILPTSGSTAGNTAVTITGTNLTGATAVDFGTAAATITSDTPTAITVTTPPGTAGLTGVVVYTPGGNTGPVPGNTFTYIVPPTPTTAQSSHGSSTDYWINNGNTGTTSGYTGPASTPAPARPTLAPAVQQTVSEPVTAQVTASDTVPPVPTNTPKSGLDAIPVLGAIGLCGVIVLFQKNGN